MNWRNFRKNNSWIHKKRKAFDCVPCRNRRWIVNNTLLIFCSRKTGDYHEKMDQHVFWKWFETQHLPNVNPNLQLSWTVRLITLWELANKNHLFSERTHYQMVGIAWCLSLIHIWIKETSHLISEDTYNRDSCYVSLGVSDGDDYQDELLRIVEFFLCSGSAGDWWSSVVWRRWGSFRSVSYTHLDVYKRQDIGWVEVCLIFRVTHRSRRVFK